MALIAYFILEDRALQCIRDKTWEEVKDDGFFFDDYQISGNLYWRSSGMLWFAPYYDGKKIDAGNITLIDHAEDPVDPRDLDIEIELLLRQG
jgi:hypothetical protein